MDLRKIVLGIVLSPVLIPLAIGDAIARALEGNSKNEIKKDYDIFRATYEIGGEKIVLFLYAKNEQDARRMLRKVRGL